MSPMAGSNEMRPTVPGVKLTYDDFVHFPDDGQRHELIDGEHYVTPSPVPKHQRILWNLVAIMGPHLDAHPVGRAYTAPLDVLFSDLDVVEPDLLYIRVYRQGGSGYERVAELTVERDDVLATPLIPGRSLPLARIFAD
jgi:Uma2 family endonuclease